MSNVECQRFFAFSKRVPKDVKRFCGICRQHGKLEETRGHICEFKDCECQKCNLVRSRRLVMSQQIRLRRAQDKRFQRTTEPKEADVVPILSNSAIGATNATSPDQQQTNQQAIAEAMADQQQLIDAKNMCYFCQKCKNHGILVWKKQHKRQCPFTNCTCDFCELIETRRRLDQHIKRRKSEPQNGGVENGQGDDNKSESDESIPRKKSTASLPAQIEAMCSNSTGVSNAFWRASPPGGAGLSIPIGIAQNRIAEQQEEQNQSQQSRENPLDALAAQISRIQQNSPEQNSRQSPASSINFGLPMSAGSTPPPTLAPMVPPSQPPSLDQQQILLMNQLLMASVSGAIPSGHSADFASGNAALPSSMFGGMEQQILAAASNSGPQNEAILGQMLLHYMANQQQQQQMMATEEMKQQQIGQMGEEQHRELLLQIIAQLLQDQDLSDQAAIQHQQQQQKSMMEAAIMMANLSGNGTMNAGLAELQQIVALQSATGLIDPTLLATLLISQQQQQFNKDSALLMPMPTVDANNSAEFGNKREEQSPPQHSQHQSAFTPIRPGGNFGGFQ